MEIDVEGLLTAVVVELMVTEELARLRLKTEFVVVLEYVLTEVVENEGLSGVAVEIGVMLREVLVEAVVGK